MVAEEIRKEQREFYAKGSSLFPQYTVPAKYRQLKIKLLQMGLDPNESDMYILLLDNGAKKIEEIAAKTGFDRTYTYYIICGLQNKGLVTATFKHPVKFRAVSSDKALKTLSYCNRKTLKEKEELLASSLAKLHDIVFTPSKARQEHFLTFDLNEAYSKAKEMQLNAKHEILLLGNEDDITALSEHGFMAALNSQLQTGISVKILTSTQNSIERLQSFDESVRYMRHGVLEPFSFIIVDNSELLIIEMHMNDIESSRAVWTKFEPFVSALYFLFSDLWESSSRK